MIAQRHAVGVGQWACRLQHHADEGDHIASLPLEAAYVGGGSGNVEQLVDEGEQLLTVALDESETFGGFVVDIGGTPSVVGACRLAQPVGDANDDGERGAQLMGDIGEEGVACHLQFAQRTDDAFTCSRGIEEHGDDGCSEQQTYDERQEDDAVDAACVLVFLLQLFVVKRGTGLGELRLQLFVVDGVAQQHRLLQKEQALFRVAVAECVGEVARQVVNILAIAIETGSLEAFPEPLGCLSLVVLLHVDESQVLADHLAIIAATLRSNPHSIEQHTLAGLQTVGQIVGVAQLLKVAGDDIGGRATVAGCAIALPAVVDAAAIVAQGAVGFAGGAKEDVDE